VAVASAGPYAPRSRQITTPVPHHSVFTDRMPFLPSSQQRQSIEVMDPNLDMDSDNLQNPNTCFT